MESIDWENLSKADRFEVWLMEMEDVLDRFIEEMPNGLDLDYSPQSLIRLEEWILNQYPTVGNILKEHEKEKLDSLVRYVGQVYRKELAGKWMIQLDHPKKDPFYGLPVVYFPGKNVDEISPHQEVITCVDRRRGDFLYTMFHNVKEENEQESN
ncbi:hypothetical protein [Paludifilum halophilum]|uniref:Uncharacterized protein n=1 Tax=Paludifilum halophilum TaxID=1642702 RepID=A0A235B627_9BACL|nr:hypothetical protein [Paludifilum halophilum]OYD07740.1 hypothetical protein CHM34_09725 [Paludifilum halophilum]